LIFVNLRVLCGLSPISAVCRVRHRQTALGATQAAVKIAVAAPELLPAVVAAGLVDAPAQIDAPADVAVAQIDVPAHGSVANTIAAAVQYVAVPAVKPPAHRRYSNALPARAVIVGRHGSGRHGID
jgi:hypothetical protein